MTMLKNFLDWVTGTGLTFTRFNSNLFEDIIVTVYYNDGKIIDYHFNKGNKNFKFAEKYEGV